MAYNGSVEVVSGLKQKNNAKFPIVEASAVYVADDKSLADIIDGLEEVNIKEYLDQKKDEQQVIVDDFSSRIGSVERTIGTMVGDATIAQRLSSLDNRLSSNADADNALKTRVSNLENLVESGKVTERINTAVNAEKTRATGRETELNTAIETERTRATNKETELNAAINTEKTRATGVESGHNTRISNLESKVGNTTVTQNIESYIVTDINSVGTKVPTANTVKTVINNETTRATNKETELNAAINTEKTRATGRETELNTAIETEKTRATNKETELNTAINTEKARATGVETGHNTRISNLESVVNTTEENINSVDINAAFKEVERSSEVEETLNYRVEYLEGLPIVMSVSNDTAYNNHLNTFTDSKGNVLAYFDNNGNFYVNGNVYCKNW